MTPIWARVETYFANAANFIMRSPLYHKEVRNCEAPKPSQTHPKSNTLHRGQCFEIARRRQSKNLF